MNFKFSIRDRLGCKMSSSARSKQINDCSDLHNSEVDRTPCNSESHKKVIIINITGTNVLLLG